MKILALNASPNKEGNTAFLLQTILDGCDGFETEMVSVARAMEYARWPFCTCCSQPCSKICYTNTYLEDVFQKMREADAIIFGSPVYFAGPSAQLKALFDKSRGLRGEKAFLGKKCAFVAVGASRFGGQESAIIAMHNMALVHGMTVINPGSMEYDAGHLGVSAQQPAQQDEFAMARCKSLALRLKQELA